MTGGSMDMTLRAQFDEPAPGRLSRMRGARRPLGITKMTIDAGRNPRRQRCDR